MRISFIHTGESFFEKRTLSVLLKQSPLNVSQTHRSDYIGSKIHDLKVVINKILGRGTSGHPNNKPNINNLCVPHRSFFLLPRREVFTRYFFILSTLNWFIHTPNTLREGMLSLNAALDQMPYHSERIYFYNLPKNMEFLFCVRKKYYLLVKTFSEMRVSLKLSMISISGKKVPHE